MSIVPRRAAVTILAIVLLSCLDGGATASRASDTRAGGPTDPDVALFVKLMNRHRVSRGLPALVWDSRAAAAAEAHSKDMLRQHYFSHRSLDGRSTWDRLAARDIVYAAAAENIAWGQETGTAVLRAWLRSPGHRENIENGTYTRHGVGKVGNYWTHVFFRPRSSGPVRAVKRPSRGEYL